MRSGGRRRRTPKATTANLAATPPKTANRRKKERVSSNEANSRSDIQEEALPPSSVSSTSHKPLPTPTGAAVETPNPHPGRGVYAFALYLGAWIAFVCYLGWALAPHWLLESALGGFDYLPAKYWAVALPTLVPIGLVAYTLAHVALNCVRFRGLFDELGSESGDNDTHRIVALDNDFIDEEEREEEEDDQQ